MDRQKEKSELIYKLGLLLCPLQDVVDRPDQHDDASRRRAAAMFNGNLDAFTKAAAAFAVGEPGLVYQTELSAIVGAAFGLRGDLEHKLHDTETLRGSLDLHRDRIIAAIGSIPVSAVTEIFEAATPFSTYCRIKDICQSATTKLVLVDRYLDASVFYRYLRDVPPGVQVTLVRVPPKNRQSPDYLQFIDVSHLYADERGPDGYQLVEQSDKKVHDRWLQCDGLLWQLGPSFKDAGAASRATLTPLIANDENLQVIADVIATGTELFGPGHLTHP